MKKIYSVLLPFMLCCCKIHNFGIYAVLTRFVAIYALWRKENFVPVEKK